MIVALGCALCAPLSYAVREYLALPVQFPRDVEFYQHCLGGECAMIFVDNAGLIPVVRRAFYRLHHPAVIRNFIVMAHNVVPVIARRLLLFAMSRHAMIRLFWRGSRSGLTTAVASTLRAFWGAAVR